MEVVGIVVFVVFDLVIVCGLFLIVSFDYMVLMLILDVNVWLEWSVLGLDFDVLLLCSNNVEFVMDGIVGIVFGVFDDDMLFVGIYCWKFYDDNLVCIVWNGYLVLLVWLILKCFVVLLYVLVMIGGWGGEFVDVVFVW